MDDQERSRVRNRDKLVASPSLSGSSSRCSSSSSLVPRVRKSEIRRQPFSLSERKWATARSSESPFCRHRRRVPAPVMKRRSASVTPEKDRSRVVKRCEQAGKSVDRAAEEEDRRTRWRVPGRRAATASSCCTDDDTCESDTLW